MDGASNTLLTAENVQRGFWISNEIVHFYHHPDGDGQPAGGIEMRALPDGRATVQLQGVVDTIEGSVAFCWPRYYRARADGAPGPEHFCQIAYPSQMPGAPYRGFRPEPVQGDPARTPFFVNLNRRPETPFTSWYENARPSSHHATVVIVSFCDGNVRRISARIDETVFVNLMTAGAMRSDAGWRFPDIPADDPRNNLLFRHILNTGAILGY
jgi:hypothetical protein